MYCNIIFITTEVLLREYNNFIGNIIKKIKIPYKPVVNINVFSSQDLSRYLDIYSNFNNDKLIFLWYL